MLNMKTNLFLGFWV